MVGKKESCLHVKQQCTREYIERKCVRLGFVHLHRFVTNRRYEKFNSIVCTTKFNRLKDGKKVESANEIRFTRCLSIPSGRIFLHLFECTTWKIVVRLVQNRLQYRDIHTFALSVSQSERCPFFLLD